ncbi:TonB-dependent receptor [Sphingobium jiangsuense]|uniref:Iron complex outermembrane receptor protein n=1 Tax=Sphingobium jiangsuense TaxID=870476 RepID=A0A7W6FN58_9SPHN|nr:TonB-dependent receptor [Sphingobium jiangsuense]MBB3924405.1 iron complex outermembrane receptor protein [Sphingobium jiangsuense]GLT00684.1 TonB-dependent receptor [Sphingobium jiangsuense]
MKVFARISLVALSLGTSTVALAQAGGDASDRQQAQADGYLSDIIVTATRRDTNIQDTPMAISAITGESLRSAGISQPSQLSSLAPSLQVDQGFGNGQTHVSIRGIASSDFGIGSNNPVALYLDDVYQPYQFGLSSQVFDLNRIEVLRGPQGTLFGKNTTSGVLGYFSQTPVNREEGYLQLAGGGGDFTHYNLEGAFNKPLTDDLAMRVSLRVDRREDYIDNLYTGPEPNDGREIGDYWTYGGRVQLKWDAGTGTQVLLKIFGVKSKGDGPVYTTPYYGDPCDPARPFFPGGYICATGTAGPASDDPRKVYSNVPTVESFDNYGATLRIDQQLGGSTLTSVSAWGKGHYRAIANADGVAADAFQSIQASSTKQYSQEVRIATPASSPLRAVLGGFVQYDEITTDQGSASTQLDVPGAVFGYDYYSGSLGHQKDTSLAAFSSVTYDISPAFSLIGGLRYSSERKKVQVNYLSAGFLDLLQDDVSYTVVTARHGLAPTLSYSDAKTFSRVTWDGTVNFKPGEGTLIFARVSSGFRSGGYQIGISDPSSYNPAKPYIDPETVYSYELGFKTELFGRRLRLNGSVYQSDFDDLQVQLTNTSGTGSRLTNAATARVRGAELEFEWAPGRLFHLNGSVGYNDARFRRYVTVDPNRPRGGNATGNRLPYAPEWTANLALDYKVEVGADHSIDFNTGWNYRSRVYFDAFQEQLSSDPDRLIGSVRVSYGTVGTGWRVTAYADNVTNQIQKVYVFPFGGAGVPNSFLIAPTIYGAGRTFGLQAAFDF